MRKAERLFLFDPASDFDRIMSYIEKYNFTIRKIINTHGHFDHISGNRYFIKKTGAELMIHENDYFFLNKSVSRFLEFIRGGFAVKYEVKFLNDGDEIAVGKTNLKVIHTPGHSPGSICLYTEGNLFTGDTLFTEGLGRTDFKGGMSGILLWTQ
jgi:glyoxylase-like metal-dependent hydrolase (beta-lactamase superfamily II)